MIHELETKNAILTKLGDAPLDPRSVADGVLAAAATLGDRIVDTLPLVERAVGTDARVLLEGMHVLRQPFIGLEAVFEDFEIDLRRSRKPAIVNFFRQRR